MYRKTTQETRQQAGFDNIQGQLVLLTPRLAFVSGLGSVVRKEFWHIHFCHNF